MKIMGLAWAIALVRWRFTRLMCSGRSKARPARGFALSHSFTQGNFSLGRLGRLSSAASLDGFPVLWMPFSELEIKQKTSDIFAVMIVDLKSQVSAFRLYS